MDTIIYSTQVICSLQFYRLRSVSYRGGIVVAPQTTGTVTLNTAAISKSLTDWRRNAGVETPWMPVLDASQPEHRPQHELLAWHGDNWAVIDDLSDRVQPLIDQGDELRFTQIDHAGVNMAVVFDAHSKCAADVSLINMSIRPADHGPAHQYRAFEIPLAGVEVFNLPIRKQLVKVKLSDGGGLWMMMDEPPGYPTELIWTAVMAIGTRILANTSMVRSVIVPVLDIVANTDLDWMRGMSCGKRTIQRVTQLTRIRFDQTETADRGLGDSVRASNGGIGPRPLRFDQPFRGWITGPDSMIPLCVFYADKDSWQQG